MRCRVFRREGFLIADTIMRAGEQKKFIFQNDIQRSDIPSCAFYAAGHHTFTKPDGTYVAARPPGTFTLEQAEVIEAGEYILTADEDGSRCFCVESDEKYTATKWTLKASDPPFELLPDHFLLVCMGYIKMNHATTPGTAYYKPRDFVVAGMNHHMVESVDPESMGILLSRG
jgi:hypothetical protein